MFAQILKNYLWHKVRSRISSSYNFILNYFYCCSMTVVPIYPPLLFPALSTPTSHLQSSSQVLCPWGPLYMFLNLTFPLFYPIISLSPIPLVIVSFFFISMTMVLFCSLVCSVDYVALISEIIWHLSFLPGLFHLA